MFFSLVFSNDDFITVFLFQTGFELFYLSKARVKTKTEYLECKFNDVSHEEGIEVRLDTQAIPKRDSKYLGSLSHGNREIDDYVTRHINVGG